MPPTIDSIRSFLHIHAPRQIVATGLRRAAVLFPFVLVDAALHILLTKRTDFVEHHKGQISFPGGMTDPSDRDALETTLREAEEEIGLTRRDVEVLGFLDDYETPSGFVITPVVGLLRRLPVFQLSTAEVEEVFTVPVSFFLSTGVEETFQREWKGTMTDVYAYQHGKHRIWGVTAAIIRTFLRRMDETAG